MRTVGHLIFGDDFEQRVKKCSLLARFAIGGVNGIGEMAQAVEGAFET